MRIQLIDDGTLDTVFQCVDCGEEIRYTWDGAHNCEPLCNGRFQCANLGTGLYGCYEAFVDWALDDADQAHACQQELSQ